MMLYCIALAYALVFWTVTWNRPQVALWSIFALAPFQNDLSQQGPVHFSIAEVNLMLTVPVFVLRGRPWRLRPLGWAVGCYVAICALSNVMDWRDSAAVSLTQIVLYLGVAVTVFRALPERTAQYRLALYGLVLTCCAVAGAVLVARSGYVLGLHKNGAGGSLACGLVVCTELWFAERGAVRRRCLLGALTLIAAGLVFTLSRGAWLTAAVGIPVVLALRGEFKTLLHAGFVFLAAGAVFWGMLPEESRVYATAFDRNNYNIRARYESADYALEQFWKAPLAGMGVGLRKEYDATNVVLLTLAETGGLGLAALAAVHFAFLGCVWRTRRATPRGSLEFSLIAIALALELGKMAHGMVDHYWSRGDLMLTWGAAGMALRAYDASRRKQGGGVRGLQREQLQMS